MDCMTEEDMGKRLEFDLDEVEQLAARGLTQEQIADALGVCERTVRNRIADDAGFAAAIKRGQARGIANVANALYENAMSGNTTSQIFFLKCRAGWKEAVAEKEGLADNYAELLERAEAVGKEYDEENRRRWREEWEKELGIRPAQAPTPPSEPVPAAPEPEAPPSPPVQAAPEPKAPPAPPPRAARRVPPAPAAAPPPVHRCIISPAPPSRPRQWSWDMGMRNVR